MTLREISDRSLRRDLRAGMKHRDADLRDTRYDTQPDARACHGAGRPDGVGHYGHPGKYEPRVMTTAANPCAPRIPMRRDSAIHIEWYLDHDAKHPIAARKGGGRRERRGVYMGGERGGREKVPVGGHGGEKGEGRHRMERKEWAVGVGVRARRSIRGELTGMWECSGNVRGRKWVEVESALAQMYIEQLHGHGTGDERGVRVLSPTDSYKLVSTRKVSRERTERDSTECKRRHRAARAIQREIARHVIEEFRNKRKTHATRDQFPWRENLEITGEYMRERGP
ncbi:hypothetical protein B0H10DRAFT_1961585 [Mycena sp. CBHHK59/15]|nr:hypothetical protein B0H10DRAFT_1961585 [Mycena sp. CBHHK59/15]